MQAEERVMEGETTASQLLLFSIKHTVSGLAWPQEQGVCVRVCADRKNVALWRAVKGAVNLEEEGADSRPIHTNTPIRRRLGDRQHPKHSHSPLS